MFKEVVAVADLLPKVISQSRFNKLEQHVANGMCLEMVKAVGLELDKRSRYSSSGDEQAV